MASHGKAPEDPEAELQTLTENLSRLKASEAEKQSPEDLQKPELGSESKSPAPGQRCRSRRPSLAAPNRPLLEAPNRPLLAAPDRPLLAAPNQLRKSGSRLLAVPDQRCKSGSPSPATPVQQCKSGPSPSLAVPDHIPAHWEEILKLQKRLSNILHRSPRGPCNDGARLSPEDETVVRDVLKYHPKCDEKIGPGIDHIKIKSYMYEYTICFWVARVDGTEIDFSYHKCLKAKAAKECPDLLPHYDARLARFKSFDRP